MGFDMIIEMTGKPRSISVDEVEYAVEWMLTKLVGTRLAKSLYINIQFTKLSGVNGECIWVGDNHRPREFDIAIHNTLGYKPTLSAIAHELVHVKQYAKGELKDYAVQKWCRWKDEILQVEDVEYWERPWEIEAFGREVGLVHKFKVHCKENDITF